LQALIHKFIEKLVTSTNCTFYYCKYEDMTLYKQVFVFLTFYQSL